MAKKLNILSIPPDKVVSIEISGAFYQRLNKLMIEYCDSKGQQELVRAMMAIKHENTKNNDFAFNIETLMVFMKALEERFQQEGYAVNNEIDVSDIEGLENLDINQS